MPLNNVQMFAALLLRTRRPAVIPGTRAIISEQERNVWNQEVTDSMKRVGVRNPADIEDFCDSAGVAD